MTTDWEQTGDEQHVEQSDLPPNLRVIDIRVGVIELIMEEEFDGFVYRGDALIDWYMDDTYFDWVRIPAELR